VGKFLTSFSKHLDRLPKIMSPFNAKSLLGCYPMTQHQKMERKNHCYPVFLFLMNFLKVVTKKTCHTTFGKKNGPKLLFRGKNV
jgi:hypothetical protein